MKKFISPVSAAPLSHASNSFSSVSKNSDVDDGSSSVQNRTDNVSISLSLSECGFGEDREEEINDALFFGTDASKCAITLESHDTVDEKHSLPLHILLNSECNLLHRRSPNVINVAARHKRLLENITAASPNSSIPLVQPEAMLFPAIFWSQRPDGCYDGAIPTALFNRAIFNRQLGFAGIEEMLRTRLKNGSSLCASTFPYIQYVFDVLLNCHLPKSDVRLVLNRGWQELKKPPSSS